MKADKDGGIPALARPLERVVFAEEIYMEKQHYMIKTSLIF